ncbi:LysR substrate-binding domain-containing protein [Streptomyces sp. NPDC059913]|uniref:LysR substrate-binding domain-containing protein n=1 Tax=unclassified Streptomyces TaxID=2593676 RepID=UPI00364FDC68
MPARQIPSTSTLLAFEAAARHGSFSLAAKELVVTEGAISRQVARLEALLGVPLFRRGGNRVELTAHGARYAEELGRLLGSLEQSTLQVMTTPPQRRVLELATIGTFATKWLIPRLPSFLREHPDVVVNLSTRNDPFVLNGSGFDAAITFAHPAWATAASRHLFRSPLIPVCRPGLASSGHCADSTVSPGMPPLPSLPSLSLPPSLSSLPLLHKTTTPESWRDYSREFGIDLQDAVAGSRFEQFSMLIEAARAGLGVALVPYLYVADELRTGKLVTLGPPGRQAVKDFILVTNSRNVRNSQSPQGSQSSWNSRAELLDEFSDWLVEEAKPDTPPDAPEAAGAQSSSVIE